MSRFKKFKPGERKHITIVSGSIESDQVLECGVCKQQWNPLTRKPRGRPRFAKTNWMVRHVKCAYGPRHGEAPKCPVPEARGIDDSMPKTHHMLDRQVRHFPYEVAGDGRDYGRKQERKSEKRRTRQTDRAMCDEWPIW